MIETRLLYYFLAVANEQNITKAADILHITQPTLSKQMMELEQQLGKQLFIRGKRKITLTDEGNYLKNKAKEILSIMENTESAFHSEKTVISGDINIACGESTAMEFVIEAYSRLYKQYPDIKIHIHSGDSDMVRERLDKGLADIGLLIGTYKEERFDYFKLPYKDIFGLLMPKDCELAKNEFIPVEKLSELPLILSEQTVSGKHEIGRFGIEQDKLNIVATYNLIYNATFLVEKGIGYALSLAGLVKDESRNLIFRPVLPEISLELYLVTKKYQMFSPAIKAFWATLNDKVPVLFN